MSKDIVVNPFDQDALYLSRLIAGEATSNEQGYSVAMNSDRTYAVIGSYLDSSMAKQAGTAFIFRRKNDQWTHESTLLPDDYAPYDSFGNAVGIDKKGTTVVVGAYMDSTFRTNGGAVYVFRKRDLRWKQQSKLFSPSGKGFEFFGNQVFINDEGSVLVVETEPSQEPTKKNPKYYLFRKHFQAWIHEESFDTLDRSMTELLKDRFTGG